VCACRLRSPQLAVIKALRSHFSHSTWSADYCVCTSLVSSSHLTLSIPPLRTIGLVAAQRQVIFSRLSATQPPQNLTNIDTCCLRVHATTSLPLSPRHTLETPHQSTSRLPSTLPWPCALSDTTQNVVGQRLEPSSSLHFNLLFPLT
jgi:hypothetical protein